MLFVRFLFLRFPLFKISGIEKRKIQIKVMKLGDESKKNAKKEKNDNVENREKEKKGMKKSAKKS